MNELLWQLFKKTGDIRVFILYKNLEKLYYYKLKEKGFHQKAKL